MKHSASLMVITGVAGFVCTVIYLHTVQQNYDPVNQLMSELALGEHGSFMLMAFVMLAMSVAGSAIIISQLKAHVLMSVPLALASVCFLGAGLFELGAWTTPHIVLVALGFILTSLVMYLGPRYVLPLTIPERKFISWALGGCMALAVVSGNNLLPIGIAQRVAAVCLLLWLSWLAVMAIKIKNYENN